MGVLRREGEIPLSLLATKPLSLQASNQNKDKNQTWVLLLLNWAMFLPEGASLHSIKMSPVMKQWASALLYNNFILVNVHTAPELELRTGLLYFSFFGCFFFLKSLLIFFACPMCHTLSNFADIVVWTSGLRGKCNLFTCTFTLNFRFMSPCEIFSGLLNKIQIHEIL